MGAGGDVDFYLLIAGGSEFPFRSLNQADDLLGVLKEPGSIGVEHQAVGLAVKELAAQFFLQQLQGIGEGGLGHKQLLTCPGDVLFICYGDKLL